ncbi:MAG: hypothetical protein R8G60_04080 [Roseovarius pacificus]|nr:hypothetical protein [Roseovarius pacificus]
MSIYKAISVACLSGLAACVSLEPAGVARLGSDPALGGGTYTSGGGITVAADLRNQGGRTMVCGVWAQSRQQSILTKLVERKVLGTGAVYLQAKRPLCAGWCSCARSSRAPITVGPRRNA